jgi:hypothetical protein
MLLASGKKYAVGWSTSWMFLLAREQRHTFPSLKAAACMFGRRLAEEACSDLLSVNLDLLRFALA